MIERFVQVENVFVVIWDRTIDAADMPVILEKVQKQRKRAGIPLVYISYCRPGTVTPSAPGAAREAVFAFMPAVLECCTNLHVIYDPKGGWIADIQRQGLRAFVTLGKLLKVKGVERVRDLGTLEDVLNAEAENLAKPPVEILAFLRAEGL